MSEIYRDPAARLTEGNAPAAALSFIDTMPAAESTAYRLQDIDRKGKDAMKKLERKSTLSRESLPHLGARELEEVTGGFPVDDDTDGSGLHVRRANGTE